MFNKLFGTKQKSCYAPFRSLRFNHSGNVLACCYNRGNILGKFPEQSISGIWFGENISKLKKAITANDFSLGCHTCEKAIINGSKEISGASQYDYLKNQKQVKSYPTMLDFELGSTCNFECIMCSGEYSTAIRVNREKQKPYYSPYEAYPELFIEQLTPFIPYVEEMRFIGGEPFLMKIYYDIWEKVLEINPKISLNVLTNASILNDRVRKMLKKGNFKISVSIDSLVKETYEHIRQNGNFDQVFENIKFFKKMMDEKGETMNFNLCVMRQNWREIPSYFDYCNQHNIQVVIHTVQFPNHCSIWNLPVDDLNEIISVYEPVSFTIENELHKKNSSTFKALNSQIQKWLNEAKNRVELANQTIHTLCKALNNKISAETNYSNVDKNKDYLQFILNLLERFSEIEKKHILDYLNKINIRLIIDEINVSSEERMYERFKIISQNSNSI